MLTLLNDGAYEGVKACAHGLAGILFAVFTLYNAGAFVQRSWNDAHDSSLTRLAIGTAVYAILTLAEAVITNNHLAWLK